MLAPIALPHDGSAEPQLYLFLTFRTPFNVCTAIFVGVYSLHTMPIASVRKPYCKLSRSHLPRPVRSPEGDMCLKLLPIFSSIV